MSIAVLLLFLNYCIDNYPYSAFDNLDTLGLMEFLARRSSTMPDDSVLYLNVGYDKALVPVIDTYGDTLGNEVITDRSILLKLLKAAHKSDYKFLILDIRFEKGMTTVTDSALWATMSVLPKFAYSLHSDGNDATPINIHNNGALSDYGATLTSGFSRWQFIQSAGKSMPLTIYETINNNTSVIF